MRNLEPIQNELLRCLAELKSLDITKAHYDVLLSQLERSYKKREELHAKLREEEQDVQALEKNGIKSLFYKVLGSEEQQLEKERQEYLDASLNYNSCQESIELLEFEKNVLHRKVENIESLRDKVVELKRQREKEILLVGEEPIKGQLHDLLAKIDNVVIQRREHLEALNAGKKVLQSVSIVLQHLRKAKEWGQWDMLDSRNSHSNQKYHAIDRARMHLPRVQMDLDQFKKEMLDIGISDPQLVLNVQDLGGFNTVFFQNIITDWMLQQKLVKSISSIDGTLYTIDRALVYIDSELIKLDDMFQHLTLKKDELLLA